MTAMKNTSKQSAAPGISLKQSDFRRATIRLTAYYTAGIFFILLVSSVAIFAAFTSLRLTPDLPPDFGLFTYEATELEHPEDTVAYELREHLLNVLFIVDATVLVLAGIASYFFAVYTLRPIEKVYEAQQRFMGDVAHELRTPLSVLKSGAENMLRQDRNMREYKEFVRESLEEADRMTQLSDDLLFLLRNKSKRHLSQTHIVLGEVAEKVVARLQSYAKEKRIRLTAKVDAGVAVLGAYEDLVRLLQNLIKNGIDYNHSEGSVAVAVRSESDYVVLTVEDTGIGIAKEQLPNIFERFYKADQSRRGGQGSSTGLGLSIVQEIVREHGASIDVASNPKEGTTITVIFPRIG